MAPTSPFYPNPIPLSTVLSAIMSAILCNCLKTSIRSTSISILKTRTTSIPSNLTSSSSSSSRFISTFSPTLPLQKKKNSTIDEFEEFEEDIIDEDVSSSTIDSSSKTTTKTENQSLSSVERHQMALDKVNTILSKSQFELRSSIPSPKLLENLLQESSTVESFNSSLDVIKKWRLKGFKIPELKMSTVLRRAISLDLPELALDILINRDLYGVELQSVRDADRIFYKLTTKTRMDPSITGEGAKNAIDDCFTLLELTKFTARQTKETYPDILGNILTTKFALQRGATTSPKGRIYKLLAELQEIGEENFISQWKKFSNGTKRSVNASLKIIVDVLIKNEYEKDAELLKLFSILEKRVNDDKSGKVLKELGMI